VAKAGYCEPVWHKSSYSDADNCVEIAVTEEHVMIRDSKETANRVLDFPHGEWAAFLTCIRHNEFDAGGPTATAG
jgi:Domain of unknown function (DUF397)